MLRCLRWRGIDLLSDGDLSVRRGASREAVDGDGRPGLPGRNSQHPRCPAPSLVASSPSALLFAFRFPLSPLSHTHATHAHISQVTASQARKRSMDHRADGSERGGPRPCSDPLLAGLYRLGPVCIDDRPARYPPPAAAVFERGTQYTLVA